MVNTLTRGILIDRQPGENAAKLWGSFGPFLPASLLLQGADLLYQLEQLRLMLADQGVAELGAETSDIGV